MDVLNKYVAVCSREETFHGFVLILLISSTLESYMALYFILHEYPVLIVYWET